MAKKGFFVVLVVVILAGGIFISMRRSHMMGAGSQVSAGGLVAVTSSGTPMPAPAAQTAAGKLPENMALQESGGLLVSLALNPYPPSGTQSSDFDVTLTDTSGQPVSDATVSLDLTMPGMWMPPNQLTADPVSAGKYHATGRFTMRGLWRIEVLLTRGGQKQSVFFDVGL
jgi:hypothetical protein